MLKGAVAAIAILCAAAISPCKADALKVAIPQRGFWDSSFVEFAQREGFFKTENLDVDAFYTDGGAATLDAVMSGSVDIGLSNGLLGVVGRYVKGAPIRVVSAEMTGPTDVYWYARSDSGIRSFKDAGGKTIGFSSPGSSSNLTVLALLKQAQVDGKPVATGGAPATLTQVMTKQIDIGWSVPPFGLQEIADGKIVIVGRGSDEPELANQTVRVNVARADVLNAKRDALKRFMKVYARAIDWAYSDPKAIDIFAENAKMPKAIALQARDGFYPKAGLQLGEIKGLDLTMRDALAFKYIASAIAPKEIEGLFDILYRPSEGK